MDREKVIVKTSIIGIATNMVLAGFKALVGVLAHSVAIVLDAVNNLSDALSSLITIIGAKLAGKAPDKEHPYGHGRTEYISATVISVIVLYAGITSLVESVRKIINPETPDYSTATLIVVAAAVIVKIILGTYVKKKGQEINSDSLVASGSDAQNDAIISASTLVAAIIFMVSGLSLEAYLGTVISIIILKAGYEMLKETINKIIGERIAASLSHSVKGTVASVEGVKGAYDLFLHDYGPDRLVGSIHIEVPDTMNVAELDKLQRNITKEVFRKHNVILEGISVYSYNTQDEEAAELRERVQKEVMRHEEALQMHGFYLDRNASSMQFDVVVSYGIDRRGFHEKLVKDLQEAIPGYTYIINFDYDISD